mmetsp:Transcript_9522/g.22950  ORF Transcript_9522/g.22950 Transcript_9522/m.22950 type:complete len:202 (-) Transcript_9522:57-662(-)
MTLPMTLPQYYKSTHTTLPITPSIQVNAHDAPHDAPSIQLNIAATRRAPTRHPYPRPHTGGSILRRCPSTASIAWRCSQCRYDSTSALVWPACASSARVVCDSISSASARLLDELSSTSRWLMRWLWLRITACTLERSFARSTGGPSTGGTRPAATCTMPVRTMPGSALMATPAVSAASEVGGVGGGPGVATSRRHATFCS